MQAGFLLLVCTLVGWTTAFSSLNIVTNSNKPLPTTHPCNGHCMGADQVCELSRRGKPICLQLQDSISKCSLGKCRSVRVCRKLNDKEESSTFDAAESSSIECTCRQDCDERRNTEPVCGSDGKTYASHCHLHRQACLSKTHVTIQKRGPCSFLTVTVGVSPAHPVIGSTVSLKCYVSGAHRRVIWYRNGVLVTPSSRLIIPASGNIIIIPSALASDSGLYACRAVGIEEGDVAVAFATLAVRPPKNCTLPHIVFPPANFSYTIDASVLVNLAPKLRNAINTKVLGRMIKRHAHLLPAKSSIVVINAVHVLETIGFLDVASILGSSTLVAYRSAVARVNAWILNPSTKPRTLSLFGLYNIADLTSSSTAFRISAAIDAASILQHETKSVLLKPDASSIEQTAFGGQMIYLFCLPSSPSVNSITWYRNGVPVSSTTRRFQFMPGGGLWVPGFRPIDAGVYTCVATNDCGQTAQSGTITFVESGTFRNAVYESLSFANATLENATFANTTVRRLELRDVVATNLKFFNVTVENLIIKDATLKGLEANGVVFSNVLIRNVTAINATYINAKFINYTTINTTLIGNTWNGLTVVNATEINQTRINANMRQAHFYNYYEIGSVVFNSTKNDCYFENYTATEATIRNSGAHNVTVVKATLTDCTTTNGFDVGVRFTNVVWTRCTETDLRRYESSIAASRFFGYQASGVVNDHSAFNGVSYFESFFVDVGYEHASLCDVNFTRVDARGLAITESRLSFVRFIEASVLQTKQLRSVRYYELVVPGMAALTKNPQLVHDPTLKDCRKRIGGLGATCSSGSKVTTVRELDLASLECSVGKTVHVESAIYGAKGKDSKCSLDVTAKLKNHCKGQRACLVPVNDKFLENSRCLKKQKYLIVSYCCAGDARLLLKSTSTAAAAAAAASKSSVLFGLPKFFQK